MHMIVCIHACLSVYLHAHTSIHVCVLHMIPSTNQPTTTIKKTGSSDGHIRYWNFVAPQRCFTVSGLAPGQPSPQYTASVSMCFCVFVHRVGLSAGSADSTSYGGGGACDACIFVYICAYLLRVSFGAPIPLPFLC